MADDRSYSTYLVLWMDIIGFSEWIDQSVQDREQVGKIAGVFERLEKEVSKVNGRREGGWRRATVARLLSDTIVVTIADPDFVSLANVISLVEHFTMAVVENGRFLRGAVTIGDHYEAGSHLFGPAMITAYEMEGKSASWPRIVVDPMVLRLLGGQVVLRRRLREQTDEFSLPRDRDGFRYINYLGHSFVYQQAAAWEREYRMSTTPEAPPFDPLLVHKAAIFGGIRNCRKTTALAKYHSLALYHNETIDRLWRYLGAEQNETDQTTFTMRDMLRTFFYPKEVFGEDERADAFFESKMSGLIRNRDDLLRKRIDDLPGLFPEVYEELRSID